MTNPDILQPFSTRKTVHFETQGGKAIETIADTNIVSERAVDLTVNGEYWLTFLCTPILIEELCAGFLFNEGFISTKNDIAEIQTCKNRSNVDIWLTYSVEKPVNWQKTSGCAGGVTSNRFIQNKAMPKNKAKISHEKVSGLLSLLYNHQEVYQQSGGVHSSILTNGIDIVLAAEDIGRHNSLDKIAGLCLFKNISQQNMILLTTGRISSEMLQKAARLNSIIVISRTSPSDLSVSYADELGITLIGYARKNNFIVYTHKNRISSK
jgi:FdhD protein